MKEHLGAREEEGSLALPPSSPDSRSAVNVKQGPKENKAWAKWWGG